MKLDSLQPRHLKYRGHYRVYVWGFLLFSLALVSYWLTRFHAFGFKSVYEDQFIGLVSSAAFFGVSLTSYFFWFRHKFRRSVQVFQTHLALHRGKQKEEISFSEIESVGVVCWSLFYVKMKNGKKHYFNSSFERSDYIWEGIYRARTDLLSEVFFENYRLKLVQYDHHQKRKEWFFRHRMVDAFNWIVVPAFFMFATFIYQSKEVIINQQGLYFFRLFMFSMLVLLTIAFVFSFLLKKLIFDKRVARRMESSQNKIRDLEFEGVILQRSKIFQVFSACFLLAIIVKFDINLFSVTKVKDDIAYLNGVKKGSTVFIDNRYNCISCKYEVKDGDYVVFGRGHIGQVMAKQGEVVGLITQDPRGRMIASENVQEVPEGHIAVRAHNGKDIVFVKVGDLIGKVQK